MIKYTTNYTTGLKIMMHTTRDTYNSIIHILTISNLQFYDFVCMIHCLQVGTGFHDLLITLHAAWLTQSIVVRSTEGDHAYIHVSGGIYHQIMFLLQLFPTSAGFNDLYRQHIIRLNLLSLWFLENSHFC